MTTIDYHSISAQATTKSVRTTTDLAVVTLWSLAGLAVSSIVYLSMNAADLAVYLAFL